ncbi:MAG: hemolysin III family protein [Micrococcales bacterium]|nr:hemolysin III family protein [Micrococcales bacterium]
MDTKPAGSPSATGAHAAYDEHGEKPRLRGVLHASMTLLVIAGGVALILLSHSWGVRLACVVYMVCGLLLFGVSAVYHLGNWGKRPDRVLQQIDHSDIFVFIAGTYTPLAVALLQGWSRVLLLVLIWTCAALGVALGVFQLRAPRWVVAGLYVVMGWIAVAWLPALWMSGGAAVVILVLVGGVVYTLGALVYAKRWPNPAPAWFGFHEMFHALTVAAAICQWVAIALAVH